MSLEPISDAVRSAYEKALKPHKNRPKQRRKKKARRLPERQYREPIGSYRPQCPICRFKLVRELDTGKYYCSQKKCGPAPKKFAQRRPDLYNKELMRSLRLALIDKYGECCMKCFTSERVVLDHIKPRNSGGTNDEDNLQLLCWPCNFRKGLQVIDYRPMLMNMSGNCRGCFRFSDDLVEVRVGDRFCPDCMGSFGTKIEPGTPLIDLFPDGIRFDGRGNVLTEPKEIDE